MEVVDLFSGLGGFSQAFLDRGHEVERYDNDPQFTDIPNTTIKDVLDLTPIDLEHADIILVSPPCNCFSPMTVYHYWPNGIPTEKTQTMISIIEHTLKIIKNTKPKYWILENPVGMLKHAIGNPQVLTWWGAWYSEKDKIMDYLEKPPLKPTHLWGVFPPIEWRMKPNKRSYMRASRGSKLGIQDRRLDKVPAVRALIPYDFSLAVCLSAEGNSPQQTLTRWCE